MTVWIIEPRDPLLVRDGRPFGPDPGARATSLPFPFPSTIAGGIRTRAGLNDDGTFKYTKDDKQELERLKRLHVRGPLLVYLADDNGDIAPEGWLVPAPRDALLLPAKLSPSLARMRRLLPVKLPANAQTDFDEQELLLIGQQSDGDERDKQSKPLKIAPSYWKWTTFASWLLDPSILTKKEQPLSDLGLAGLEREYRLHVSIEAEKEIARDGKLFETSGLEFTAPGLGKQRLKGAQRLALAVDADDADYNIRAGLAGFGGERRIVTWRKSNAKLPACPDSVKEQIVEQRACRVLLLTPAHFEQGYRPTWLLEKRYDVRPDLRAIAIDRPQVVSGWDLVEGKPKPSRRLAPAGTVLFLRLNGDETAIKQWIDNIWMQCVSDDVQDRIDGFGIAALGTWSGEPPER